MDKDDKINEQYLQLLDSILITGGWGVLLIVIIILKYNIIT